MSSTCTFIYCSLGLGVVVGASTTSSSASSSSSSQYIYLSFFCSCSSLQTLLPCFIVTQCQELGQCLCLDNVHAPNTLSLMHSSNSPVNSPADVYLQYNFAGFCFKLAEQRVMGSGTRVPTTNKRPRKLNKV